MICTSGSALSSLERPSRRVILVADVTRGIAVRPFVIILSHQNTPPPHRRYDDGDALMVANVGPLVEPITVEEWDAGLKSRPQGLYAHNTQTLVAHNVHAGFTGALGMLGRIVDSITGQSYEEMVDPYRAARYE